MIDRPTGQESRPAATTYPIAVAAWVAAGIAPWLAAGFLVSVGTAVACDGGTDCSWGFELVLALPVLLAALLWSGPLVLAGRAARHGRDRDRARRVASRGGLASIVVLFLGAGSGWSGFISMTVVVALGVPALTLRFGR